MEQNFQVNYFLDLVNKLKSIVTRWSVNHSKQTLLDELIYVVMDILKFNKAINRGFYNKMIFIRLKLYKNFIYK